MVQYSKNITRSYEFPRFWGIEHACALLPLQYLPGHIFMRVCRVAFTKNMALGTRLCKQGLYHSRKCKQRLGVNFNGFEHMY